MPRPGDDVRFRRKRLNWTQQELAKRAEVNVETVNRIEAHQNVRMDTFLKLNDALHEGERLAQNIVTSPVTPVRDVRTEESAGDEEEIDVSGYEKFSIPVIAEGDASPEGIFWTDEGVQAIEVEEWMSRPNDPAVKDRYCYGVKVRGDSMEPLLKPGMKVIVSPNLSLEDGALGYVQLHDGERLIKMVRKHPAGYVLESLNTAYPARFVERSAVKAVHRIAYIRTLK